MKKPILKIILFFGFLILQSLIYAKTSLTNSDETLQKAILVKINQYRVHHGLSPLKMESQIVKEARNHSIDMANHTIPFGHKYFLSRIDRLREHIKNAGAGAENVAYNYKDAEDVVKNWLRSPGHKRNIDGNYNLTGVGIARDKKGKIYFTQIFINTRSNHPIRYVKRHSILNFFR